jgi:hypothetical protein
VAAYPTPRAVVLTSAGVFYDNGRRHPLSARLDLNDLGAVLTGAAMAFRGGEGVIIIDAPMPTSAPAGWKYSELKPWTTFTGNASVIHVGWLPELDSTNKLGPLLEGHQGPADLASRLGRYHQLVGVAWRYTAGVSGCAALRARFTDTKQGSQPLWRHKLPAGLRGAGPLVWRGKDQPEQGAPGSVHVFDINAMYLAGMKNAQLAWGPLVRYSGGFDHRFPGFWELATASLPAELLDGTKRPPVVADRLRKGSVWVTTPVAKYLGEVTSLDVLDAWISENPQTIARPLAERWIAARQGDFGPLGPVAPALKRTYTETVGMVAREGGSIQRIDWSATWGDLARTNMLRRVDRVGERFGLWPVAVQTDAVYYVQPSPGDPGRVTLAEVLGEGTAPGTFKYEGALTVDQYRAKLGVDA